jgi:hypothetical protein
MKKAIIILLFTSLFLLNVKATFALSLIGDSENWFYTSIADSMWSLETSLYTIDLPWKVWTKEKLNAIIEKNCIKENLTEAEIRQVAKEWNIITILNKIDDSCKNNWEFSISLVNQIVWAVITLHNDTKNTAQEKVRQIMNIGSTWIYADWIEENAPFDWIIDLKNIDKIIFTQKTESYEWMNNFDLSKEIWSLVSKAHEINRPNGALNINLNWSDQNDIYNEIRYNELKEYNDSNSTSLYSTYVCSLENSNSGLNQDSIFSLTWDDSSSWTSSSSWYDTSWNGYRWMFWDWLYPNSNYSPIDDNRVFPCSEFFCIDIWFNTYNHEFLWWNGGQEMSIESIIARSNEHLKKFSNTSLVQSKMTINNFELWLKDLNLSDIFHMWVQITTKPVPILNLTYNKQEKQSNSEWTSWATSKDDKTIFELRKQLEYYYKTYWLDYIRRNDLSLFKKIEADRQSALNSALLTPWYQAEKLQEYSEYEKQLAQQRELMRKLVENEVKIWILWDFEKQFKELEVFNKSMKDYIFNLKTIISNMLKNIPTDTWAT